MGPPNHASIIVLEFYITKTNQDETLKDGISQWMGSAPLLAEGGWALVGNDVLYACPSG